MGESLGRLPVDQLLGGHHLTAIDLGFVGDEVGPLLLPSRLTPAAGAIYLFQFHSARLNILKSGPRGTQF